MQSQNGPGNYTGERLARERPEVYRQIIELVAQDASLNRIAKQCAVSRHTISAVRENEAIPIAQRKQEIMCAAARVATARIHRIEDELAAGKIKGAQLVPVFGVSVDKLALLSNDPTQVNVTHTHEPGPNLYQKLNELAQRLSKPRTIDARAEPAAALPALPNGETISDSGGENSLNRREQSRQKDD